MVANHWTKSWDDPPCSLHAITEATSCSSAFGCQWGDVIQGAGASTKIEDSVRSHTHDASMGVWYIYLYIYHTFISQM